MIGRFNQPNDNMKYVLPDIEKFTEMIPTGGDQPVTILIPATVHHCTLVRVDCRQHVPSPDISER